MATTVHSAWRCPGLQEALDHPGGILRRQPHEGAHLVGIGPAAGQVRQAAEGDERHSVAVGNHGDRGAFHVEHLRSEEHTSELQSLMRISYAVFCLKKKKHQHMMKQCSNKLSVK